MFTFQVFWCQDDCDAGTKYLVTDASQKLRINVSTHVLTSPTSFCGYSWEQFLFCWILAHHLPILKGNKFLSTVCQKTEFFCYMYIVFRSFCNKFCTYWEIWPGNDTVYLCHQIFKSQINSPDWFHYLTMWGSIKCICTGADPRIRGQCL